MYTSSLSFFIFNTVFGKNYTKIIGQPPWDWRHPLVNPGTATGYSLGGEVE